MITTAPCIIRAAKHVYRYRAGLLKYLKPQKFIHQLVKLLSNQ